MFELYFTPENDVLSPEYDNGYYMSSSKLVRTNLASHFKTPYFGYVAKFQLVMRGKWAVSSYAKATAILLRNGKPQQTHKLVMKPSTSDLGKVVTKRKSIEKELYYLEGDTIGVFWTLEFNPYTQYPSAMVIYEQADEQEGLVYDS